MLTHCLTWLRQHVQRGVDAIRTRASRWTTPRPVALATGLAADLTRSRGELLLENALLRQRLLVLQRAARRPRFTPLDRGLLVLLASRLRTWAGALLIVQPETVLRWHGQGGPALLAAQAGTTLPALTAGDGNDRAHPADGA